MSQDNQIYHANNGNFNSVLDKARHDMAQASFQPMPELGKAALRMEGFTDPAIRQNTMAAGSQNKSVASLMDQVWNAMKVAAPSASLDENGKERPNHFRSPFTFRQESMVRQDMINGLALASNPNAWGGRQMQMPASYSSKTETVVNQDMGMAGGFSKPQIRLEAFNNIDQHASIVYSVGYGASITRQTDFVMGWYPPIMMSPDETALTVKLNLLTVHNGMVHDTDSGNYTSYARRNVARAFENPNILNRFATLAMPIYTDGRKAHFVDTAIYAPRKRTFGNRVIETSYLKFNNDANVLGLSTTEATLDSQGKPTHRETLEPGTKLEGLLFKSGNDVFELPTLNLRTMNFIGAQQWDQQESVINGNITLGLSGQKLKTESGGAMTGPLKILADNKLRIGVNIKINGSLNIETSNYNVSKPSLRLVSVESIETGESFPAGSATWDAVEAAVKGISPEGFMFRPFKTNSTKRIQGDRLNTRRFQFQYIAPYRDPISVERMVGNKGEHDAQDLTNLMGLVKIRIENEAVDHMFEMFDLMRAYVDMNANDGTLNDLPGLAQFYLIPCFHEETLDLEKEIDSIKSSQRAEDIQAFLVLKLRDISTRLLTFMQWKAAMIMQNNDTLPPPQINIATNPITARYLLAPGDMRTLGDYDFIVTTTLNRRLKDKIALSFRIPGQEASNEVQIFGWGHTLLTAELVFASNMFRDNDYFSELQVQPRYDFIPMNLSGALLTLKGLPEVLGKIEGYTTLKGPLNAESQLVVAIAPAPAPVGP